MSWFEKLLSLLESWSPLEIVMSYERAIVFRWGRVREIKGPGPYLRMPIRDKYVKVSVALETFTTAMQTVTTANGETVTFSASIKLRVTNVVLAEVKVQRWDETALEDISAILADTIATREPKQLDPEQRGRLLSTCKQAINRELAEYGVEAERVRFNNFVRNMRSYRLFNDQLQGNHS